MFTYDWGRRGGSEGGLHVLNPNKAVAIYRSQKIIKCLAHFHKHACDECSRNRFCGRKCINFKIVDVDTNGDKFPDGKPHLQIECVPSTPFY